MTRLVLDLEFVTCDRDVNSVIISAISQAVATTHDVQNKSRLLTGTETIESCRWGNSSLRTHIRNTQLHRRVGEAPINGTTKKIAPLASCFWFESQTILTYHRGANIASSLLMSA